MSEELRQMIVNSANQLGISPLDLATAISYETAGTFDPVKRGPTTQWGQHRGLIQWGEPQAQKYLGGDFSIPKQGEGIVAYMKDAGVRPGMGMLDVYSAINAGRVGRYNASDANNGGAPGNVRDKVEKQMAGHRQKATALLGSMSPSTPSASPGAIAPAPATDIPKAVQSVADAKPTGASVFDILGSLAPMQSQSAPSPAPVVGPSPQQANALASFIAALKQSRAPIG